MNVAVFLDKDGTIIRDVPYNADPDFVELVPGCANALSMLKQSGFLLILVTNQSGVARGLFAENDLVPVFDKIDLLLAGAGVKFDDHFYCPHHPQGTVPAYTSDCSCRKPLPGMLFEAALKWEIDLNNSWMIGDILNDAEAGNRAGCKTILLNTGNETEWIQGPYRKPYQIASSLTEAATLIINSIKQNKSLPSYGR